MEIKREDIAQNQIQQLSFDDVESPEVYEDVVFSDDPRVVQHNFLIENKPRMSKDELKMFLSLVSLIGRNDSDLKPIKLKVTDIIDLWGGDRKTISPKNGYKQVKKALAGLLNKKFSLEYNREDGTRYIEMATYISSFSYGEGDGYATVKVDPMFKPYLINLNKTFTQFRLREAMNLDTAMAIRTYELLVQYETIGKRIFTVAEFKRLLGIPDKYKGSNSNLKKNILDKVVVEISEKTHLMTRYDLEGRGESAKLSFIIYSKKDTIHSKVPKENRPGAAKTFGETERDLLFQLVKSEHDMDVDFSDEQIKRAIEIVTAPITDRKEILEAYHVLVDALLEYRDRKLMTKIEHPWPYFKKILDVKFKKYNEI